MRLLFVAVISMVLGTGLAGQEADTLLSDELDGLAFGAFADSLQARSGWSLFYLEEWTAGLRVDVGQGPAGLREVLKRSLPESLTFFIDEGRNIFIVPKDRVRTERSAATGGASGVFGSRRESTKTAQYFGSRTMAEETEERQFGRPGQGGKSEWHLYGTVSDTLNGESLIGATIFVEETGGGTITDQQGQYRLVLPPGSYTLAVHSMGMKRKRYRINLYANGELDVGLSREIIALDEVSIQAEGRTLLGGINPGQTRVNLGEMKEVPVVMGERDVLKVAQMTPGVQAAGEGSAGYHVRGSAHDQNLFYVNHIPVYNTAHLFGFFSAFSPDIIKDLSLYKGHIPAAFGGRIASVFDVSTREGNSRQFGARGGIGAVTGHLAVEGPLKKERHSYVLSARSSYSDWILRRLEDPALRNSSAAFSDFSAGVTLRPGEKDVVRIFAYHSRDSFRHADVLDYRYMNSGASVSWHRRMAPGLSGRFTGVYSAYHFGTNNNELPAAAFSHTYRIGHYEGKADFNWTPAEQHLVHFGAGAIFYDLDRGSIEAYGSESLRETTVLGEERALETALYISDQWEPVAGLSIYAGIRYSYYALLGPSEVLSYDPDMPPWPAYIRDTLHYGKNDLVQPYHGPGLRLALNYRASSLSAFKMSYNRLRQYLFMLGTTVTMAPTDQWKLCDAHIAPPVGDQFTGGFYRSMPEAGLKLSLEAYCKQVRNVVEYRSGADLTGSAHVEGDVLQGRQRAWGIESKLDKEGGRLNGWLSYAWSRSFIEVDGAASWERINGGSPYPANYDRPHALNTVLSYRMTRRISFSGNMVYATGRPVTYPESVYALNGQLLLHYSDRNAYRLPDYFRIDLSLNLEGNLRSKKLAHSYWMFSIYNVTGRRNAHSVYFRSENGEIKSYRLSIFGTPVFSVSWNFKLGNYATE